MRSLILVAALGLSTAISWSQSRDYLSYASASKMVDTCSAFATDSNVGVAIIVVDVADQVVASARMDSVLPAAYEGAGLKAYSALNFYQPSEKIAPIMDAQPAFKDIPRIVTIPGGYPIFSKNGVIVGAIGVAGFPDANTDAECAAKAVKAVQ